MDDLERQLAAEIAGSLERIAALLKLVTQWPRRPLPPQGGNGEELLSTREAAALAKRTPETIRAWVRTGRLEDVGEGRPLYRRGDVLAAVAQRRRSEADTPAARAAATLRAIR